MEGVQFPLTTNELNKQPFNYKRQPSNSVRRRPLVIEIIEPYALLDYPYCRQKTTYFLLTNLSRFWSPEHCPA